jgi:myosin heavy subunit
MHLGNVAFIDKETNEGDVAMPAPSTNGYDALDFVTKLLGLDKAKLVSYLVDRPVVVNGERMVVKRNSRAAKFARDATAKGLYSVLFDWLVSRVNQSLVLSKARQDEQSCIGVLDIFGFEVFQKNNFEQLLINFCNESLQAVFNKSVFVDEAELYKREGLVLDEELSLPPDNSECMRLLDGGVVNGGNKKPKGVGTSMGELGVLALIDAESQNPQPSDHKMVSMLHRYYDSSKAFVRPHPKDADVVFIVEHYAGRVTYSTGSFVEKNNDQLPPGVEELFKASTNAFVANVFGGGVGGGNGQSKPVRGT